MRTKEATEVWELFRDTCTGPKEPVRKLLRNLDERLAELEAENTRLRSCLEDAAENERLTTHEFNQLKEERDKLRELVRDYDKVLDNAVYVWGTVAGFLGYGRKYDALHDCMKELGVEV